MASVGSDLIARAKKYREVDTLQHESVHNVAETLEKISKFLQDHETLSNNDCTHTVFDNYSDWWMNSKPTYKLAVAEDNTVDQLHRMVATLYDLGIPLTLTEKRTPEIRFIQEVEIWGNASEAISAEELIDAQGAFMKLLGETMGRIFPNEEFLDCVVFDATGFSRTKGIQKTSVRFVWSKVIVDKNRALKIHDYVVHKFKDSQDEGIKAFEAKITGFNNKDNSLISIFNDAIYVGRYGVRMPLCDRVSPAPLKKPENRPFKPLGVVRCHYQKGEQGAELQSIERVCSETALQRHEWLKIGCIRRDAGTALTEWTQPVWTGPPTNRTRPQGIGGGPPDRGDRGGYQGGGERGPRQPEERGGVRQPGRVNIRTSGGSGDKFVRAKPRTAGEVAQENTITVQREFDGTLAEFRDQIEKCMGSQQGANIVEDEQSLVWTNPNDKSGRIEMKAGSRRVYIQGKAHQVRSLCMTVAPFVRHVGDGQSSVAGTARTGSRQGSRAGSEHTGTPSQVYQPSMVPSAIYAPSAVHSATSYTTNSTRGGAQAESTKRVVNKAFVPEGQGELALDEGDHITVTHDPEQGSANSHRWVHGLNETSQARGWFPLSYTSPLPVVEDVAE
jgi:hypothetical protein